MCQTIKTFTFKKNNQNMAYMCPTTYRPDFEDDLKAAIPVGNNEARCHSFGYNLIASVIAHCFNIANDSEALYTMLEEFSKCIYPYANFGVDHTPEQEDEYNSFLNILRQATGNVSAKMETWLTAADIILRKLNNSTQNLRIGNKGLNSRISYSYDPLEWKYVKNGYYITNTSIQPMEDNEGLEDGLYITHEMDITRILYFANYIKDLFDGNFDYPFGIDLYYFNIEGNYENPDNIYIIAGSSNNVEGFSYAKPRIQSNNQPVNIYLDDLSTPFITV